MAKQERREKKEVRLTPQAHKVLSVYKIEGDFKTFSQAIIHAITGKVEK